MTQIQRNADSTDRVFFITFLRALAACLITNAHYTGIYPTDIIANGGLIGDVLFFAVSGYCLYNIKLPFLRWYGKRLARVYIPVLIATAIFVLLGAYQITSEQTAIWWFVYPTYYHFVASIIILYIPFYVIMKIKALQTRLPIIMGVVAVAYVLVYVFLYDKTYYHIDTVREPMIRFLFMESMLLGAWFRQNDGRIVKHRWQLLVGTALCFVMYIVSKVGFSRNVLPSSLQVVNQLAIFLLLFLLFKFVQSISQKLELVKRPLKRCISFISNMTLEIYLVQYVLIDMLRPYLSFPLNWMAITCSILGAACVLHYISEPLSRAISRLILREVNGNVWKLGGGVIIEYSDNWSLAVL